MDDLFWSGGRLCGFLDGKAVSFSVDEAYSQIPKDDRIAEACWNVLKPYGKGRIWRINFILNKERQGKNGNQIKQSEN